MDGRDASSPAPDVAGVAHATTRDAAAAALLGGLASILAMLGARAVVGIPTPAEIYGDQLTALIPLPLFARLLEIFGSDAKHWFFVALVAGEGLASAAAGLAYWWLRARLPVRLGGGSPANGGGVGSALGYRDAPLIAGWLWLLAAGVLAPVAGGGVFGASLAGGVAGVLGAQAVPDAAFALVFLAGLALAARRRPASPERAGSSSSPQTLSRRRVLWRGAAVLAVLAGGAAVAGLIARAVARSRAGALLGLSATPPPLVPPPVPAYGPYAPVAGQTPEVTAASHFYYVSKNLLSDPLLDPATWRLQITGLVDRPYALSYDALRALPAVERYQTLECISNEVGGDLMSDALFTGTRLADVLAAAGVQSGATQLIFRAADGYSDRLHLAQALDPRSLIVYLIDGEPLPQAHGFPARLLIPGLYGMKNGKWLTELALAAGDYQGYWEVRGWTPEALVKTTSRIDVPRDGATLAPRPTTIAGVAYAADRGIGRVEVTTDGGLTWQAATLKRPLGDLTWVLWELPWTPVAGLHVLAVRAVDLQGNYQSATLAGTLPDGASGYHIVRVVVR